MTTFTHIHDGKSPRSDTTLDDTPRQHIFSIAALLNTGALSLETVGLPAPVPFPEQWVYSLERCRIPSRRQAGHAVRHRPDRSNLQYLRANTPVPEERSKER